jgi:hypothetical protein
MQTRGGDTGDQVSQMRNPVHEDPESYIETESDSPQ